MSDLLSAAIIAAQFAAGAVPTGCGDMNDAVICIVEADKTSPIFMLGRGASVTGPLVVRFSNGQEALRVPAGQVLGSVAALP